MKTTLAETQTNLEYTQKQMDTTVNRSPQSEEFQVSDKVVLSTKNIKNFCPIYEPKLKLSGFDLLLSHRKSR